MSSAASSTAPEGLTVDAAAPTAAPDSTSNNAAAETTTPQNSVENPKDANDTPRPLRIYTRTQLLHLHRSPLVQPPPDMPELKAWFGTENEQNLAKKDVEQTTPGGSRDRRFRRDLEDGETPSRPSFRSTLTQPSQMGNFKHQSLRDRDKDRDRDGEKDRERDIRDREGQERLRHLSDKYDRDRLSLSSTNARTKDRDSANSSTRTTSGTQLASNSSRREPRDSSKRKVTEPGDDWRRGDNPRNAREERSDTTRRDRERSRLRDSSRTRPEPTNRRERGGERDDTRDRNGRDRDDSRREREDEDDGRHWRDDGRRDERVAARKVRERTGDHYEPSSDRDRRWPAAEDRDGRYKRTNGRDRRGGQDDARDRDDRKERDREKEKEKEPAWMETYVPEEPLPGILGAVSSTGELDGIQAWKKGLKEKEKDDKDSTRRNQSEAPSTSVPKEKEQGNTSSPALDEIQLFRLMMQKEQGKKDPDTAPVPSSDSPLSQMPSVPQEPKRADPAIASSNQDSEAKVMKAQDTPAAVEQSLPSNRNPVESPSITHPVPFEKPPSEPHFNPPSGPRLLALGRGINKPPLQAAGPPQLTPTAEVPRGPAGFAAYDAVDVAGQRVMLDRGVAGVAALTEGMQRLHTDRSPLTPHQQFSTGLFDNAQIDANGNGYAASKGSRFAKFFDGKTREAPLAKVQPPVGFTTPSPNLATHGPRFDQGNFNGPPNHVEDSRAMDDIIAMLANSQAHRAAQNPNVAGGHHVQPNASFNGHNNHPLLQQHLQQLNAGRSESLYDSRLDDRSFVPDGMVPGLRNAPPPRSRDNIQDSMDDPIIHLQRLQQQQHLQQHRPDHNNFGSPGNAMFAQQARNPGLTIQQQSYRGGPSPNTAQQLGLAPSRGMPPGLANLGSRPPHEASQFIGLPGGPNGPQLAGLPNGGQLHQQQQQFNNFNGGNLGYGNQQQQQFRGPAPSMNLQGTGGHPPLGNLAQNNIDPRLAAQFGLGGGIPVGQRGLGNNSLPLQQQQQRPGPHLGPHMGLRPQQQGQLPPHMLPHMHHPNGGGPQGPTTQPAQDLMALLMGGSLRE